MIERTLQSIVFHSLYPTLMLLVMSCLPEPLEVKNIPVVKPEIVVSTQLVPNESVVILLTKTFGALDFSEDSDPEELLKQIAVNDASVTLTGPSGAYDLLFLEDGFYGGVFIPFQEGEVYELRIRSESLGEVYATAEVQAQVPFTEANARLYYNSFDDTLAQINYAFQDLAGSNWYMVNVQRVRSGNRAQNTLNPRSFTVLLNDTQFEGELRDELFLGSFDDYAPGDTIALTLSNISEEYYQFVQMRLENRLSFLSFLGEPVNYPSNIVGGKGYFNLHVPDVRVFVLE